MCDVMEVWSDVSQRGYGNLPTQPLNFNFYSRKAVGLHETVREGIEILATEAGFQDVSADDVVEFLESRSLL
jgi:hypothetical protein